MCNTTEESLNRRLQSLLKKGGVGRTPPPPPPPGPSPLALDLAYITICTFFLTGVAEEVSPLSALDMTVTYDFSSNADASEPIKPIVYDAISPSSPIMINFFGLFIQLL